MFDSEIFEAPPLSADRLDLTDAEWELLDLPAEVGRPGIPTGLDSIEPGPALGAILSTIDVSSISGPARVVVLQARHLLTHVHKELADSDSNTRSADAHPHRPGFGLLPWSW